MGGNPRIAKGVKEMKFDYEQALELRLLKAAFAGFEKWREANNL